MPEQHGQGDELTALLRSLYSVLNTEVELCPHCIKKIKENVKQLHYVSPYVGTNHSYHSWKGQKVSELEWKILNTLEKALPERVSQDDLVKAVWSADPTVNRPHALRQKIYTLRRKLTSGWSIDRSKRGYLLVKQEQQESEDDPWS